MLRSAHELRAEESSYAFTAQQIKDDVKATTQVDPIVDIGGAYRDVKSVSATANVGRRKTARCRRTTSSGSCSRTGPTGRASGFKRRR